MSLTTALNMARSSLTATAGQSAIISRNVANAGNASATRKLPKLVTMAGGGVLLQVRRRLAALRWQCRLPSLRWWRPCRRH